MLKKMVLKTQRYNSFIKIKIFKKSVKKYSQIHKFTGFHHHVVEIKKYTKKIKKIKKIDVLKIFGILFKSNGKWKKL